MKTVFEKKLSQYRKNMNFNPVSYVEQKRAAIVKWCNENNINHIVVGVSGGIDSAVVYKILKGTPLAVTGVTIPIKSSIGTTGQEEASTNALLLDNDVKLLIGSDISESQVSALENVTGGTVEITAHTVGQMDYYIRPTLLYGIVAHMSNDFNSVVCGTMNMDECSYIGFFGKKTDTCDIQIISDLHKSEVYKVGEYLGVPQEILDAQPSGGLWSGNTDVDEIGATYDEIELYTYFKHNGFDVRKIIPYFSVLSIETKRKENIHKYKRELDTHFIDIESKNRLYFKS